jgi:hypothetical protein
MSGTTPADVLLMWFTVGLCSSVGVWLLHRDDAAFTAHCLLMVLTLSRDRFGRSNAGCRAGASSFVGLGRVMM